VEILLLVRRLKIIKSPALGEAILRILEKLWPSSASRAGNTYDMRKVVIKDEE